MKNRTNQTKPPKMLLLKIRDLAPGMTLAKPIHTDTGCTLLARNKTLSILDIERLKRWKQRFAYVYERDSDNPKTLAEAS